MKTCVKSVKSKAAGQVRGRKLTGMLLSLLAVAFIASVLLTSCGKKNEEGMIMIPDGLAEQRTETPYGGIINPASELRGIWIATVANLNFPLKQGENADKMRAELDDIVASCVEYGFNAIFFQVRPASDALYDSDIFPSSVFLTGKQGAAVDEDFDPLAYLLEKAHDNNIRVHAWVNPLRVTSSDAYGVSDLSSDNPAALHPEWTVKYADGKIYYDAGIPEVQKLVVDGVTEIVRKYDVDGVVFDDYFYPYPKSETVGGKTVSIDFDDAATYAKYGAAFADKGDFRRNNINTIVKGCYDAIKAVDDECLFGIAPFGIWKNDDGTNGGSDTKGLSSYSAIYCDPLAWIEGRYIDYISPQIYWQFSTDVARYDVLTRWWNAALDGTGIALYISHAAYRYDTWENIDYEMKNQIEYARSELAYRGSVMYGYAAIKANSNGIADELKKSYADNIIYSDIVSNGHSLMLSSPENGATLTTAATYILGSSDPYYSLTCDGKKLSRTKSGYFSLYVTLKEGANSFVFEHKGEKYTYTLYYKKPVTTTPASPVAMNDFAITSATPKYDVAMSAGSVLRLTCKAPAGSTVTATVGDVRVTLAETKTASSGGKYTETTYTGSITVPSAADGEIKTVGKLVFTAKKGGETASFTGGELRALGKGATLGIEINKTSAELKTAQDSWYYDDYTPQAKGMRTVAVALDSGYYRLEMGGYVAQSDADETGAANTGYAVVESVVSTLSEKVTKIFFGSGARPPMSGNVKNGKFILTVFDAENYEGAFDIGENPLFSGDPAVSYDADKHVLTFSFLLDDLSGDNFYGFEFGYEDGGFFVSLRNPQTVASKEQPLLGKTIVLDAGHGGSDNGAAGAMGLGEGGVNEADVNLAIVLAAKEELEKLGAKIVLTRFDDSTVGIYDRLDLLDSLCPDLCISIHQNSMDYSSDVTKIRGLIGLYFAPSGKLLTKTLSAAVSDALDRFERTPSTQRLAMVRNPRFPSTLIEVGFISCVEEYERMTSEYGTTLTARALADGVVAYYEKQAKWMIDPHYYTSLDQGGQAFTAGS